MKSFLVYGGTCSQSFALPSATQVLGVLLHHGERREARVHFDRGSGAGARRAAKPRNPRKFEIIEGRRHYIEFIRHFLSPGSIHWYGPFGSSKAWISDGVPGKWQWSMTNQRYMEMSKAFPVKSPTENLVSILSKLRIVSSEINILKNNNKLKEVALNG